LLIPWEKREGRLIFVPWWGTRLRCALPKGLLFRERKTKRVFSAHPEKKDTRKVGVTGDKRKTLSTRRVEAALLPQPTSWKKSCWRLKKKKRPFLADQRRKRTQLPAALGKNHRVPLSE